MSELRSRAISEGPINERRIPFLGNSTSPFILGLSHLVSGYPKVGKTELLVRCVQEWASEGFSVLYVTEEPEVLWRLRLVALPENSTDASLAFALGSTYSDILTLIDEAPEELIVVDTLRLLSISDENDNAQINRALTPLIATCRNSQKTLIIAHHTRKGGGEHGEAAAGGHALLGIVDVAIEIKRDGQSDRRRIMRGWGRVFEVPELIYELQDDKSMRLLGDPKQLALKELGEGVKHILTDELQTNKGILEQLPDPKPSTDQLTKSLVLLGTRGDAEREPPMSEGPKQGTTYKWRIRTNLTSDGSNYRSEVKSEDYVEV